MLKLWRKWIAYPIGWLVIMVLALGLVGWLGSRTPGDVTPMERFHGTYTAVKVGDEVHLQVTEAITDVLSRSRLGITRVLIPHYDGQDLGIGEITVKDPLGKPYPVKQNTRPNGDLELLIDRNDTPRAIGSQEFTFIISYELRRSVVTAGKGQELYQNINGTEWNNGFRRVSAEIRIDPSLVPFLTGEAACYQGRAGSRDQCDVTRVGDTFRARIDDVGAYENMTLAVGLEPGTVAAPLDPLRARSHGWWGIAGLVGIGLAALAVALLTRRLVRRPPSDELGIVTQFTPPDDLEPVLAADFLGVPERGAAAHLAWMAAEGLADVTSTLEAEAPAPAASLSAQRRRTQRGHLTVNWHDPRKHDLPLMTWPMRHITEGLFGGPGRDRRVDDFRSERALRDAQVQRDRALAGKMLRRELRFGPTMLWLGYLALIGYGLVQIWLGLAGLGWWFLAGGTVGVMLLLWAFHLLPVHGRPTALGEEMQRYLAGLERFVTISEGERIRWLNSIETAPRDEASRIEVYEKLLPWAIVFGAEDSWRQVLGDMYSRFPEREPRAPAWSSIAQPQRWVRELSYDHDVRHSPWSARPDIGQGTLSHAVTSPFRAMGDALAGRGDSNSSTRGSGRGWDGGSGGSFGGFSGGGSSGGGFSGGGLGGGGGGRR